MHARPLLSPFALGTVLLAFAACGTPAAPSASSSSADDADHGGIAGAAELSEPQLHLTTIGGDGGILQLDLLDETVTEIGTIEPADAATGDGRYLFAETAEGLTIVDSGMWTWDHVDHFHYYRAEPRILGTVDGSGPATVATTNSSTTGGTGVFFAGAGVAVLLDTAALSKGEIVERFRLEVEPHDGLVVPVGSFALVTGADGTVSVHTATGAATPGIAAECLAPRGTITTRVGAVIGCHDGALLATVVDGTVEVERIPLPEGAGPVSSFANREGRPTVAGLDESGRILLLDTRERAWTVLDAPAPLRQVSAVDDAHEHLLGLAEDGRVLVIDGASGALLAATDPLLPETLAAAGLATVSLIADDQRAYLNAPAEKALYEIDYADAARIARVFETDGEPAHLALTGR
ncbi:ABC transporter [Microbacterium sp. 18062]|uniref:ABC transporter n=1 Tax=Microbacterium sp. 18062 TaxID=2681410 RepID=UPI001F3908AC|nr:ABC transporter [Microbacterium sp. 18062]